MIRAPGAPFDFGFGAELPPRPDPELLRPIAGRFSGQHSVSDLVIDMSKKMKETTTTNLNFCYVRHESDRLAGQPKLYPKPKTVCAMMQYIGYIAISIDPPAAQIVSC